MRQLKISERITKREESLDIYLTQIGHEPLISMEEEIELAQRIRQGDDEALNKLVRANLRFVVSVAKQYQNQDLSLGDLIDEGNIGLITAAKKFDETRGFKFISYAVWWIRQSIMQYIAEHSRTVRLPLNQVNQLGKLNKLQSKFEQEHHRKATTREMAEELDLPEERVEEIVSFGGHALSLDTPVSDDQEETYSSKISNQDDPSTDNSLMKESLCREIDRVLATLPERDSHILKMCFGIGYQEMSLDEISENVGLTRERVRQIKEKALRHLRQGSRSQALRTYLG